MVFSKSTVCSQEQNQGTIQDSKVCECIQGRGTMLMKGLEAKSHDEWLRTLALSSFEKKRVRCSLIALQSFPSRGSGEREREVSISAESSDRAHRNSQSYSRGDSDWMLGGIFLIKWWSNAGTGFLERQSMSQACQCVRGIWTITLITCFNFWSGN